MQNKKRLAIYVFFDNNGIADEYQFVLLDDLKKNIDKLLIVVNGKITDDSLDRFKKIADDVLIRENKGLDTMAYKEGLLFYSKDELKEFYEIVLLNDTVYGPFFPFSEMFNSMEKRGVLDFWGITVHERINADPFNRLKTGYVPRHIQSYFMVFRNKLFTSKDFIDYWDNIENIETYYDAICEHEVVFTKHFEDLDYKWAVYIDTSQFSSTIDNYIFNYGKELIEQFRCPIVKKRVFFHEFDAIYSISFGQQPYELFQYIKKHTNYDENLILKNLIRTKNQRDLYKNLKLSYILPSDMSRLKSGEVPFKKIALIIHIYFPDLVDYCLNYMQNMPDYADIIVTTDKEFIKKDILEKKAKLNCNHFEVRLIPNRGRSESAILVAVKDIVMNYDIVCFAHDKKSAQVKPDLVGESFSYKCFENVLGGKNYVENILHLFKENPHIGFLSPTPPNASVFYGALGAMEWGPNFKVTECLLKDINVDMKLDETKAPLSPLGGIFWFKPQALQALYDRNFTYDDFPMEPINTDGTMLHAIERAYAIVAQYHGFYPAYITKDTFATLDLINLAHYIERINSTLIPKYGPSSYDNFIAIINSPRSHLTALYHKFKVFVVKTFPKPFVKFCKKILRLK